MELVFVTGFCGALLGGATATFWWAIAVLLKAPGWQPTDDQSLACVVIGGLLVPLLCGVLILVAEFSSYKEGA